ncbi:unnamed protein product [Litomosoides sigmodontis]|uniref:Uncharacterized protein n=1 Tax=Litomosoides sigmodontis TaxID=42156 RepID=A0A3P6U1C5_LITSI|nr:unnamed protein product [Litomosoides sigmodontis]
MLHSSKGKRSTTAKSAQAQAKHTPRLRAGDDTERVEAAIFFLRCQEWMTRKYVEEIRIIYLKPLDELCSGKRRKVESVSKSTELSSSGSAHPAIARNIIDGAGDGHVTNADRVAEKLQQALKALQQDDGDTTQDYRPVTREKTVSLADCSAFYRLKTILKAIHELLDVQASLDKWFENNRACIDVHKGLLKNLLTNALTNFEMAYIITELFAVQQVSPQEIRKAKPEYSKYIRPDIGVRNIEIINKPLNEGFITTECIKKLEGQISHFRIVACEMAKNLEIIIETVVANVRDNHLEVNAKQIATIIDNLPPRYRFPEAIQLTPFAMKLLTNASPGPETGDLFSSSFDAGSASNS